MSEIIPYHIKRSARARHARLRITADKKLTVTLPLRAPLSLAETLVVQHKNWIIKHLMRTRPERITLPSGRADYLQNKHPALSLVRERLNFFNQHYNFHWKSVSIKNATTRWGSCSRLKNLNFNYKIIYLPPELQDYLIVHELCHLGEFNHGPKFWELVARTVPDHGERRKELARISRSGLLPR
jgi:predicted metal-dependent hydrolase